MENLISLKYKSSSYKIRIFGNGFLKRNKNNFKMIIDDKEIELEEYHSPSKEVLKIKLKIVNEITDLSGIFAECQY